MMMRNMSFIIWRRLELVFFGIRTMDCRIKPERYDIAAVFLTTNSYQLDVENVHILNSFLRSKVGSLSA